MFSSATVRGIPELTPTPFSLGLITLRYNTPFSRINEILWTDLRGGGGVYISYILKEAQGDEENIG